ncbi:MAG: NAD(+)/NADH kinase, partial [Spirochaetales bacterium]|nr:NAD(+)/NADH kinase [Candidatus Physcosoma equi]
IDLIITLGGDGTVLFAARSACERNIPVLPVNLGTFGYITEIEKNEWKDSLDAYIKGEENISNRLMLKVSVYRDGEEVFFSRGLNDMVICANGIAKMIYLQLIMDNTIAGHFRCDGMIVATPTGSTGYSLAAGGPILEAEMNALVITPISPFTLSNRPVVTGEKEISVIVSENQRTGIVLTVDGQVYYELKANDRVVVSMSSKKMKLIKSTKRNFTEVIRDKLKWAGEMKNNA